MEMDISARAGGGQTDRAPLRLLFVTWDSPGTSYLESLFLPIFAGLRPYGIATRRGGSAKSVLQRALAIVTSRYFAGPTALRQWRRPCLVRCPFARLFDILDLRSSCRAV
jgi:hypothetical protein